MDKLKRYRAPVEETVERIAYAQAIYARLESLPPLPDLRPARIHLPASKRGEGGIASASA